MADGLGTALRDHRQLHGLTQRDLAELAGVSERTVRQRHRDTSIRLPAPDRAADAAMRQGLYDQSISRLQEMIPSEPLHEELHAKLMLASRRAVSVRPPCQCSPKSATDSPPNSA